MGRCAAGFLIALWATPTLAAPPSPFRVKPRAAAQGRPLNLDARALRAARESLSRARPEDAVALVSAPDTRGFRDRRALLRGDAFLALDDPKQALRAYEEAARTAETTSVRVTASRGVVECLRILGRAAERLAWIDALREVVPQSSSLKLARAEALIALKRFTAADAVIREMIATNPTSNAAAEAERLRAKIPHTKRRDLDTSQAVRRIRAFASAGRVAEARADLARLPQLTGRRRLLLEWELARDSGDHEAESSHLDALVAADPAGPRGAEVLLRRGRIALNQGRIDAALADFDRASKLFPQTQAGREASFLAGWAVYDEGRYKEAELRFLTFVASHPRARQVTEALWFAGWSAYLDARMDDSITHFDRLLAAHPRSDLVPFAHYWSGRAHQRQDHAGRAVESYRRASSAAPLRYHSFWARKRSAQLGAPLALPPPRTDVRTFSFDQIIAELGPRRPISVDRAIALMRAGIESDVDDEVRSLLAALPPPKSDRETMLRVDLARQLGAEARAFRFAASHQPSPSEYLDGDYWATRALQAAYPLAFEPAIATSTVAHQVPASLMWSVMRTESHYRSDVVSRAGAFGLMQILPRTARNIARTDPDARRHAARLEEPASNVWLGGWYLNRLTHRYDGFAPATIGAYNAGPPAMDRWLSEFKGEPVDAFIERISYRETRRYVRRVLETAWIYEALYGLPAPALPSTVGHTRAPADAVAF